jgi:L-arabinose isomerase
MGIRENTNETSVDDGRSAEPKRLAGNTNEIAEGDEVEAHAAVGFNTNETSVEDKPAEPQRLASNTNETSDDEVEAHGISENTNETSVEDRPAEPQKLASNTNEDSIDDSRNA